MTRTSDSSATASRRCPTTNTSGSSAKATRRCPRTNARDSSATAWTSAADRGRPIVTTSPQFDRRNTMEIPKDKILDMIKQHGKSEQVDQADKELPDQV